MSAGLKALHAPPVNNTDRQDFQRNRGHGPSQFYGFDVWIYSHTSCKPFGNGRGTQMLIVEDWDRVTCKACLR